MPRLSRLLKGKPRLERVWRVVAPDHISALAWSPDGRALAAAAVSGPVLLFDPTSGSVRDRLPGHGFGTTATAWLDTQTLATAGQDGTVRLWDAVDGRERLSQEGGAAWVERLAVYPGGAYFAAAAGRTVRIWDRDGRLVRDCLGHASTVADLAWRPGTNELAVAAYGGVTLWTPDLADPPRKFEWKGSTLALAWAPNGQFLAAGGQDATVHFWYCASGQDLQMCGYPTKVRELAWDGASRYLATGGGCQVTVWDCSGQGPEGTTPLNLAAHDEAATVSALAYQRRGPVLACGGTDGRVVLWQPGATKKPLAQDELHGSVTQLAWSPDEARLAVGCETGDVYVFRV
jgi:WD40 repeat protein